MLKLVSLFTSLLLVTVFASLKNLKKKGVGIFSKQNMAKNTLVRVDYGNKNLFVATPWSAKLVMGE